MEGEITQTNNTNNTNITNSSLYNMQEDLFLYAQIIVQTIQIHRQKIQQKKKQKVFYPQLIFLYFL